MASYSKFGSRKPSVADILRSAQAPFTYVYDGNKYDRREICELIIGLKSLGKALKCFVNRPYDPTRSQVPGNLFYLDNIEDLEAAEQFGEANDCRILSFQIVHSPKQH